MAAQRTKSPKDLIGGALMIAMGVFFAIWAQNFYNVGVAARMGPGWFPVFLGYTLAVVGLIILVAGFFKEGDLPPVQWVPMFWLTASVVAFAATVKVIGMTPAIFLQIGLCVLGDPGKLSIKTTLIMATLTAIACDIIFYRALEVQLPPFIWPFQ